MSLAPGTRLGPYEILAPLGAGGMGEVYRARDTRLDRDVALKVLPDDLARDLSRRQRFEQEARSVAALNHPNIVAIYDVGENYFISELVDGESLRAAGSMPPRRAIELAAQIADGLAAAHAGGVTHRDLKPENIMVTRSGRAKILDFGLAKVTQTAIGAEAVTRTQPPQTQEGVVMGTVGYMSPEQVRGLPADPRSDIFSFGLVLYEMLAGRRAFIGASSIEIMSSILKEEPAELPETVPPALKLIVEHCLEKSPDRRFQSARDLGFALQSLSGSGSVPAATALSPAQRVTGNKLWTIAIVVAVGAAGAAFWIGKTFSNGTNPSAPPPAADRGSVTSPPVTPMIAGPIVPRSSPKPLAASSASSTKSMPPAKEPAAAATPAAKSPPPAASAPKASEPASALSANETKDDPLPSIASSAAPVSSDAKAAYDQAMRLFDEEKTTESVRQFDDAIRLNPDYLEAYIGRAAARRNLRQNELSLQDCNKAIQIKADDPRGYHCRGLNYYVMNQYDAAVREFSEAIRLNPKFALAFERRGNAYTALQQHEKAIQDYTQVIRLRPRNAEAYVRRAVAYTNLKQYDKAVQDYTEAIRLQPGHVRAYNGRASVEELLGDATGAAADRRRARESRKQQ